MATARKRVASITSLIVSLWRNIGLVQPYTAAMSTWKEEYSFLGHPLSICHLRPSAKMNQQSFSALSQFRHSFDVFRARKSFAAECNHSLHWTAFRFPTELYR